MHRRTWLFVFGVVVMVGVFAGAVETEPARATGEHGNAGPGVIKGLRVKQGTVNAIVESFGLAHIMGEVVNGSRFKVAAIVVEAKLFDAQGRLIDTQSAPTLCVWKMSPGDLAPFDIQFLLQDDIERYEVSVKAIRYTGAMVTGVTLERLQWRVSPFSGRLTAEGFMRNRSKNTYWSPTACAAVFTTRGRFILAGETLGQLTEQFGPGTRKAFGGEVGTYAVTGLGPIVGVRVYVAMCTNADRKQQVFGCF